jgi:integrase
MSTPPVKTLIDEQLDDIERKITVLGFGLPFNEVIGRKREELVANLPQRLRAAKLWQEENLRPAHPGYASIRIHDLKHTFGRRLRAAGVTEEDRKALLGHKNGSIISHYSGAELGHLIEAANMVSATDSRGPVLTILKRKQA